MMRLTHDQFLELARAAATDAGNRSMRKAGRKVWSQDDADAAADEYNRLVPLPEGVQDKA